MKCESQCPFLPTLGLPCPLWGGGQALRMGPGSRKAGGEGCRWACLSRPSLAGPLLLAVQALLAAGGYVGGPAARGGSSWVLLMLSVLETGCPGGTGDRATPDAHDKGATANLGCLPFGGEVSLLGLQLLGGKAVVGGLVCHSDVFRGRWPSPVISLLVLLSR